MTDETRADESGTPGRRTRHMRLVHGVNETPTTRDDPERDDDPDPGGPTLLAW